MAAPPVISARDRQIMAALTDPAGPKVDPFEYAEWRERPEIQRALAAQDDLDARHDQAIARQIRDEMLADTRIALATLKTTIATNKDAKDPKHQAESRRAAAHILRLANRHLRPPPTSGGSGRAMQGMALTRRAPSSTRSTKPRRSATHEARETRHDLFPQHSPNPQPLPAPANRWVIERTPPTTLNAPTAPSAPAAPAPKGHANPAPGAPTSAVSTAPIPSSPAPAFPPSSALSASSVVNSSSPQHSASSVVNSSSPQHSAPSTQRSLPPSPPAATFHPAEHHTPESAVRTQLDALRTNDQPEPDSGVATLYAFTAANDLAQPASWAQFAADFLTRLARFLLGFATFRTRQTDFKRGWEPRRHPSDFVRGPRDPGALDRATIRVDLTYPDGRTAALNFRLAHHPIPGSRPLWLTREIEVLDSS